MPYIIELNRGTLYYNSGLGNTPDKSKAHRFDTKAHAVYVINKLTLYMHYVCNVKKVVR